MAGLQYLSFSQGQNRTNGDREVKINNKSTLWKDV